MTQCPRYPKCSVPICPLDAEKDRRVYLKGEPKCTLPKSIRMRLGKDLPWKGLFPREYATWKQWQGKSPEERSRLAKKLVVSGRQTRFAPRSRKPYSKAD